MDDEDAAADDVDDPPDPLEDAPAGDFAALVEELPEPSPDPDPEEPEELEEVEEPDEDVPDPRESVR